MSIHIYFSHRLDALGHRMAANLQQESASLDPFTPATIIVPNPNVKTWLQLHLARRDGVAINLQFPFLERGLWDALREHMGDAAERWTPLDRTLLQAMIQAVLISDRLQDHRADDLRPLTNYLYEDGKKRNNFASLSWQLAGRLAALFVEYGFHRGKMVDAWVKGRLSKQWRERRDGDLEMETCQMRLYYLIFAAGGWRDRRDELLGTTTLTLPECADRVLGRGRSGYNPRGPALHFFGLSQISAFHRDLLLRLARTRPIHIYQLSVCAEYWEDITTIAEDRWWQRVAASKIGSTDNGEELQDPEFENPLLKAWGKTGREGLKLLSQLEDACAGEIPFDMEWLPDPPPAKKTVLAHVQRQVLNRQMLPAPESIAQDSSLQITGCPGIFREVETVYASIVDNLQKTPDLSLTDIAVMVPDMASYQPVIQAVFERKPKLIPYNLGDSTAADESVYGRAVLDLLALASGSATRKEVFALVMNPCFLAAMRMTRDDAIVWLKWADTLNVFRNKSADESSESLLHTWRHALIRLRLGRLMKPSTHLDPDALAWQDLVPFADLDSQDSDRLGMFCSCLELLLAHLKPWATMEQTGSAWRVELLSVMDSFLAPPADRPAEAQVRKQLGERLRILDALDDTTRAMAADTPLFLPEGAMLNLALVKESVQEALASIPSRHGAYLSGGVNVSSLRPMRPIPFRITYILGLDEGGFPGYPDFSSLDLRNRYRLLGDITAPEENQFLFLEALMSASDKLYLTFVNQELAKEKPLHPCTVVNQLVGSLRKVLSNGFQIAEIPLISNSLSYLEPAPAWSDMRVNHQPLDRIMALNQLATTHGYTIPGLSKLIEAHVPRQTVPDESEPPEVDTAVSMQISDLARFLENPIEAGLRYRLGLYQNRTDQRMLAEHEPFASDSQQRRVFVRTTLKQILLRLTSGKLLQSEEATKEATLAFYGDRYRRGETPDGLYHQVEQAAMTEEVNNRIFGHGKVKKSLTDLLESLEECLPAPYVCIGDTSSIVPARETLPPVTVTFQQAGKPIRVDLSGELELCWHTEDGEALHILILGSKAPGKRPLRQVFPAFLACAALKAGEEHHRSWIGSDPFTIHYAHNEMIHSYTYDLSGSTALPYLQYLSSQLLNEPAFDNLPFAIAESMRYDLAPFAVNPDDLSSDSRAAYRELMSEAMQENQSAYQPNWYPTEMVKLTSGSPP